MCMCAMCVVECVLACVRAFVNICVRACACAGYATSPMVWSEGTMQPIRFQSVALSASTTSAPHPHGGWRMPLRIWSASTPQPKGDRDLDKKPLRISSANAPHSQGGGGTLTTMTIRISSASARHRCPEPVESETCATHRSHLPPPLRGRIPADLQRFGFTKGGFR